MQVSAVIAASGQGSRMGAGVKKQFLLLKGVPILARVVNIFCKHPLIGQIVTVIPPGDMPYARKILKPYCSADDLILIEGAQRRQDSVLAGLQVVDPRSEIVCIHDGVRPLLSESLIERVIEGARRWGAAVPLIPVTDTIKEVNSRGEIEKTVPRLFLRGAQTPQAFRLDLILQAYRNASLLGVEATDDSYLVELAGETVHAVEGEAANIKITCPGDLTTAGALLKEGS